MYPYLYIFGRKVGTYGICMVAGFMLAGFLAYRKGKTFGLRWEDLLIVGAMTLAGALLFGGGLYVGVTYSWEQILIFVQQGEFGFLASGIVFYGGLIGGILGALLGMGIAGCRFGDMERAVVLFIPLGHAIGRIGCVLAGCCHGIPYTGPFALYYPHSVAELSPQQGFFPVQPLESLVNVVICLLLLRCEKQIHHVMDLLFVYLGLYAVSRFFLEFLRGDTVRGLWEGLSTSQWISVAVLTVCILRLLFIKMWSISNQKT